MRHEAAAVNAAGGYARTSGELGVVITSTGAGNAAGSLIEAQTSRSRDFTGFNRSSSTRTL